MDLRLARDPSVGDETLGRLFVNDVFECFSLEDVVRVGPKVVHETAIPAGRYRVIITRSARFARMLPLVCDVPGFSGIRIHAGNTNDDTSGCILVGQSTRDIGSSRAALTVLQPKLAQALARGEDCWITIHPREETP